MAENATVDRDFELYKILIEEVRETRRARRELSNGFLTTNLAGVGALGFLAGPSSGLDPALLLWASGALVLTCLIWRISNLYYTGMLSTKYEILYEVENRLGIDPLQREWGGLPRRGLMRWFSFERAMPILFVAGYVVFVAYRISWDEAMQVVHGAIAPLLALVQHFR